MKKCRMLIVLASLCISFLVNAQNSLTGSNQPSIALTTGKTTSILFPSKIVQVDRGTLDILAQQVKQSENMLLVKAAREKFPETNLTVVTADGKFYSFLVRYEMNPGQLVYYTNDSTGMKNQVVDLDPGNILWERGQLNPVLIQRYAMGLLLKDPVVHGPRRNNLGIDLRLLGIYVRDNMLFYQFSILNESVMDYDIDYIRLYVKDLSKTKHIATQEEEVKPIYIAGNGKQVSAGKNNPIVFALEKYTLPDEKIFVMEIHEKNGGRHLTLKLGNRALLKAHPLPDIQ